jgi:ferredoxin
MIYSIYFSPTGTSKTNALEVAKVFDENFTSIDLTVLDNANFPEITKDDLVIFSFPVYSGRIFSGIFAALEEIKGNGAPCICLVNYGNREYDDSLKEVCTFAKSKGFVPFASSALIGQHTYGSIAVGRPNRDDLKETREFFQKVKVEFLQGNIKELSAFTSFENNQVGKRGNFRPLTSDSCIECGLCAKNCPTQAINYVNYKEIDNEKCIACFRCITICPVKAKNIDIPQYKEFAKGFTLKLAAKRENQYFK